MFNASRTAARMTVNQASVLVQTSSKVEDPTVFGCSEKVAIRLTKRQPPLAQIVKKTGTMYPAFATTPEGEQVKTLIKRWFHGV